MEQNNIKNDRKIAAVIKPLTLSDLRKNDGLWYRILVLIYDFQHQKDERSKRRMDKTIHPIYISSPYFTLEEAESIKTALVKSYTLETTIYESLRNFTDKRKASGDYRPCGPHDMLPTFLTCFGIEKSEITDEKFVSRVKRHGLKVG